MSDEQENGLLRQQVDKLQSEVIDKHEQLLRALNAVKESMRIIRKSNITPKWAEVALLEALAKSVKEPEAAHG